MILGGKLDDFALDLHYLYSGIKPNAISDYGHFLCTIKGNDKPASIWDGLFLHIPEYVHPQGPHKFARLSLNH
jgi:hypothetical protein